MCSNSSAHPEIKVRLAPSEQQGVADRRLSVRALMNNLLQTVRSYGTSQCGQYRYEFTYELTRITKVSTQWYIGINILATSVFV